MAIFPVYSPACDLLEIVDAFVKLWFRVHDVKDVLAEEAAIGLGAKEHGPGVEKRLEHVKIIRLEVALFSPNSKLKII